MDTEISRWGEAGDKNAQYVIQPYYVPANVVRFYGACRAPHLFVSTGSPGGCLSGPFAVGRIADMAGIRYRSEHVFTSGVPFAWQRRVHMNLYVYDNKSNPLQQGVRGGH